MSAISVSQTPISLPLTAPSAHADTSAVVSQMKAEVIATYRIFCEKYRPDMNPLEIDVMAGSAFDALLRKAQVKPSNVSQVSMMALLKAASEQLGLAADAEMLADQEARVKGLLNALPHHLTAV